MPLTERELNWREHARPIWHSLASITEMEEPPSRQAIVELHFQLDLLEYLITPKLGWEPSIPPIVSSPICAHPGCPAGWREGLINQARADVDPVWHCTVHAPNYQANGASSPPGTLPPLTPRLQLANDMADRWTYHRDKLVAEEKARQTQGSIEAV